MTHDPTKAEKIIISTTNAIKYILQFGDDVIKKHKKDLIDEMLWKLTEANGKYTQTFISEGAKEKYPRYPLGVDSKEIRLEHVCTRDSLIEELIANPQAIDNILKKAIACIVTKEEHSRLPHDTKTCVGWERYEKAGIRVYNTKTSVWVNLQSTHGG